LMADTGQQYILGFVFAALLSFLVQSSLAVSLLAMTLAGTGLLPEEQAVMIVYGAMVGSSGATALLAQGLQGAARQVAMFQTAFNLVGAIILVPMFYIEVWGGIPGLLALIDLAGLGTTQNIVLAFVAFSVIAALAMAGLLRPLSRLLEHLWPQDADADTRLRFIHDQALSDPATALYLARQEQARLIAMLSWPLALLRSNPGPKSEMALRQKHAAFIGIDNQIGDFLHELSGQIQGSEAFEELNRILKLQRAIEGVERSLLDLTVTLATLNEIETLGSLPGSIIEGIDTVALVLQDLATDGCDPDGLMVLAKITEDADGVMRKVRQYYLASEISSGQAKRMTLLRLTNMTERVIWQMGELGQLLPDERL
jgi:phosphate:Na+ symporter